MRRLCGVDEEINDKKETVCQLCEYRKTEEYRKRKVRQLESFRRATLL